MYNKELYEKYKECRKRAAKKYYESHKEERRLYWKEYYQKHKKERNRKNQEYKAKDPKWKEYVKECSTLCNMFLYPEQIPEKEDYVCISDLNYQIEKGGYINGSKC